MHLSFVNKVTNFLDHGIGTCLPILFSPKHQKYHPVFIKEGREDFIPTKKIFATNKTTALGDHHKWT
jgi:hypothetical protein